VDYDALGYESLTALGDVAGTVSKGMTAEAIAQLPTLPLAALMMQHTPPATPAAVMSGDVAMSAGRQHDGQPTSQCDQAAGSLYHHQQQTQLSDELLALGAKAVAACRMCVTNT
jgi:hypothetical protein